MKDNQNSWGGSRPGAGMKPRWNCGATKPLRLPEALHDDCLWYARLIDGQFPNGQQVSESLACRLPMPEESVESVTESSGLSEPQTKLDKIRELVATRQSEAHPTSPRWKEAKKLLAELEDLLA